MDLKLPTTIASRRDIIRVHREIRSFIDTTTQSIMRHDNPIKYPALTRKLIREAVPFLPILGAKIRQIPAPKTRMIYDVVNDIKGMRVIVYYQTLPSQKRKK